MLNDKAPSTRDQICVECGKQFFIPDMRLWAYKLLINGSTEWFCRYNCMRSTERKYKDAKTGRKKDMKSKKPLKEVLESNLRAGLSIAMIAKKHGGSVQSVHNWIKAYGLAGIQGQKKDVAPIAPVAPTLKVYVKPVIEETPVHVWIETVKDCPEEVVQESPPLKDIEQFHTDEPVQELPKVEFDLPEKPEIKKLCSECLKCTFPFEENKCGKFNSHPPFVAEQESADYYSFEDATPIKEHEHTPKPQHIPTLNELLSDVENSLSALNMRYVEQADNDFRAQLLQLVLAITNGRGLAV